MAEIREREVEIREVGSIYTATTIPRRPSSLLLLVKPTGPLGHRPFQTNYLTAPGGTKPNQERSD